MLTVHLSSVYLEGCALHCLHAHILYVNNSMTNRTMLLEMLHVAGSIFLGFGSCALCSGAKARERRQQRAHVRKDLSLFPQSSCYTVQSCCRGFCILEVLTLSHQLQDIDVTGLSGVSVNPFNSMQSVRAVRTYSWNLFDTLTFSIKLMFARVCERRMCLCT